MCNYGPGVCLCFSNSRGILPHSLADWSRERERERERERDHQHAIETKFSTTLCTYTSAPGGQFCTARRWTDDDVGSRDGRLLSTTDTSPLKDTSRTKLPLRSGRGGIFLKL